MKTCLRWIQKIFASLFMAIGATVFVLAIIGGVGLYNNYQDKIAPVPLPESFMLSFEMNGVLRDMNNEPSILDQLIEPEMDLYTFLITLEKASQDERVTGLFFKINDGDYSLTQIETIRNAVLKFGLSGKKTIAFSTSYGDFSNGTSEYWLASAFDEIRVQPAGFVSLNGVMVEQPYLKDALDKVGVEPEMVQRKAYKTGGEMYTRSGMSDEGRETLGFIVDDIMDTIVDDIAQTRNLSRKDVKRAIDISPLTADDAYKMGLVDQVGYVTDLERDFVSMYSYREDQPVTTKNDGEDSLPKIALVHIDGVIADEMVTDKNDLLSSNAMVLPDDIADGQTIADAIKDAADRPWIKVILIRVNSPGGSPTASETIRHAVTYARDKDKFVIVSMGDVAASGGYWVSVNANQIIAAPLTLTGSIGVYGGKMNFKGLWDKLGVNWDSVSSGDNAGMWSFNQGYDEQEKDRLDASMDYIYDAFVERVSEGRSMDVVDVEQVAQGRVWLGLMAKYHGLVDLTGGFDFALKRAAAEAGGLDWKTMDMMVLPKDNDPVADLMELIGVKSPAITIPSSLQTLFHRGAVLTVPYSTIQF